MQKAHTNINWVNLPSTDTPINETNLNAMDNSIDVIDDRVIVLDTSKANQSDLLTVVRNVELNSATGVITITFMNGSTQTYDTKLEKIAINFEYDDDPTSAHYQQLIITLDDGTKQYIDMSALVTQYEFADSSTISFTQTSGTISAIVKDGSITRAKIDPDYLAQIDLSVASAQASATASATSASESLASERNAEAWAVGQKNGQDVPSTDAQYHNNAKYYSEQASESVDEAQDILDEIVDAVSMVTFTVDFATGNLIYSSDATYNFSINTTTGNLEWEVVIQ